MRGHTYKRGARWTAVFDEPSPEGKRRQRSKGGSPTQKAAQGFLTDQLARIGSGTYTEPSKLTVAQYFEREWLPDRRGHAAAAERPALPLSFASTSCRRSAHSACRASRAAR